MTETLPWYALYTKPRHEKKLADLLNEKGIEAYVPVRKVLKQWSDRKKMVEEPVIRSYCFVRANPTWYYEVLNTPGAVRYVWFSGKAAPIPDSQINTLKMIIESDMEVDCISDQFPKGAHVRITAGPLIGTTGELISHAGSKKVIIRIDHLEKVVSVKISPMFLEKLPDKPEKEKVPGRKYRQYW